MKAIAIVLFVFQGISLVGSVINGTISRNLEDLMFMNGLYGYGRLLGYFLPAIIGAFCLHIHKKNCLKEKASDAEKPRTSPAAEAPQPARMPQPAADAGAVRVETKHPTMDLQYIMTSQLVYLWMQTGNADYLAEYKRRLKMCGLNEETIQKSLEFDMRIFRKHPRPEMLDPMFVSKPLLTLKDCFLPEQVSYYKTNFDYPLSYVIRISDEADYHFWHSHEQDLPDAVWQEIFSLSDKGGKSLFLPLAMFLTTDMGWTVQNVNKFSYNEQGMLDKYRWKRGITGAAKNPWQ